MKTQTLISLSDFGTLIEALSPQDFNRYVLEVLEASQLFGKLQPAQILNGRKIDILTTTFVKSIVPLPQLPLCAIEVMRQKAPLSVSDIERLFKKWQDIQVEYPDISFCLVSTSGVSHAVYQHAQERGMDILDVEDLFLFTSEETQIRYFNATFEEYSPRMSTESHDDTHV